MYKLYSNGKLGRVTVYIRIARPPKFSGLSRVNTLFKSSVHNISNITIYEPILHLTIAQHVSRKMHYNARGESSLLERLAVEVVEIVIGVSHRWYRAKEKINLHVYQLK